MVPDTGTALEAYELGGSWNREDLKKAMAGREHLRRQVPLHTEEKSSKRNEL